MFRKLIDRLIEPQMDAIATYVKDTDSLVNAIERRVSERLDDLEQRIKGIERDNAALGHDLERLTMLLSRPAGPVSDVSHGDLFKMFCRRDGDSR